MTEIWKAIPGWEGSYEVSDVGRVRSLLRVTNTRKGLQTFQGKILAPSTTKNGYRMVSLTAPSRREYHYVHALVLLAFIGPRPAGMEVCHNDGSRDNNNLRNLRYDTRRNNALDRHKHGTLPKHEAPRGSANKQSKLKESDILKIREMPGTLKQIGEAFGVSLHTIHLIKIGKTWKHVTPPK